MGKTVRRAVKGEGKKPKMIQRKSKRNAQHSELAMLKRK